MLGSVFRSTISRSTAEIINDDDDDDIYDQVAKLSEIWPKVRYFWAVNFSLEG